MSTTPRRKGQQMWWPAIGSYREILHRVLSRAHTFTVIHNDTVGHASAVINVLLGHIENELSPEQSEIFNTMRPKESDMTVDLLKVDPAKK